MSKTAVRYVLLSLLVCSLGLMLRGNVIASPSLSVFQYTLGTPDGLSPGNPFIPGLATSYFRDVRVPRPSLALQEVTEMPRP